MNITVYKRMGLFHKGPIVKHQDLIHKHGHEILSSESFNSQDKYMQHGDVSVKQHCICVANTSIALARFLHIKVKERSLIRGALLHDYFLYDWHLPHEGGRWHGYKHAKVALRNAERDFELNNLEREIIKRHMWPLNLTLLPLTREAWIVNIADTYCSLLETMKIRKGWK